MCTFHNDVVSTNEWMRTFYNDVVSTNEWMRTFDNDVVATWSSWVLHHQQFFWVGLWDGVNQELAHSTSGVTNQIQAW